MKALLDSPMLAGAAGLMLTGAALYLLRAIPARLLSLIWRSVTVRLTVNGDDEVFDWVNEWLAGHSYSNRARTLKLSAGRTAAQSWSLAPGYGHHVFWDSGPVMLERVVDDKAGGGAWSIRPRERIVITILGRSQARLRAMIARANAHRVSQDAVGVRVWTSGCWLAMPSKPRRSMDTIFLPPEQKREIVEDAAWFFSGRQWHADRGIPYRRGYLFCGPPGTGKTSFVMALASAFSRPIYILNLATMQNDNELLGAFSNAGQNSIILIEDIDAASVSAARVAAPKASPDKPPEPIGVSLSGLLNAIDGVAAPEGRLLCLTTNHAGKLDPALVRAARIDKRFEIGPLAPAQVAEMAARFFPGDETRVALARNLANGSPPRPAADWQVELMDLAREDAAVPTRSAA